MSTTESSTDQLIEFYLTKAKATNEINVLANSVAAVANLQHYFSVSQYREWFALCERYQDWVKNIQTGK